MLNTIMPILLKISSQPKQHKWNIAESKYLQLKSICVSEHQMNNSAVFSIQHSGKYSTACGNYSTVGHMRNKFWIAKSSQSKQFFDQKCFKPVKALLHFCNMKK